jgi:hypothetical protein
MKDPLYIGVILWICRLDMQDHSLSTITRVSSTKTACFTIRCSTTGMPNAEWRRTEGIMETVIRFFPLFPTTTSTEVLSIQKTLAEHLQHLAG